MQEQDKPLYSSLEVLRRLLSFARGYVRFAVLGMVGIIGSQLLGILIPDILRRVIDRGIEMQDQNYMFQAGLLVIGLGVLRGFMGFLARYFSEAQSHYVAYDIRNAMYDKIQRLPFAYHDKAHTGNLITRSLSDVDEVQRFLGFGLLDGLNTLLVLLFSMAMMFYVSAPLALIAVLPFIPLGLRSRRFAHFVDNEWKRVMERLGKLGDQLQESIVGAEVVRAFAREPYEIQRFEEKNQALYDQQIGLVQEWARFIPYSAVITAISTILVLIFGAIFERNGTAGVTVGVVVQFNAYILLISQPIRFSGFIIMLYNQGIASGRRILEVLDTPESIEDKPNAIELPTLEGEVSFKDVNFRYHENLPLALQDINFTARPGQVVALVGQTGSGKSSLVGLIPRFYDVSSGQVLVDGQDVRDVSLSSLKRQIGFVLQESLLFSASIRENIAFGRPDASQEAIEAAAEAADAHRFITEFPNGYDTLVGERGVTLSGGQRQRIAIARALLLDPRILIMDDSTSSVDTNTEYQIQQALKRLLEGRTTFIIAQRLTSVMLADVILVMHKGRIAEQGTHDELLAQDGHYRKIYDLQLADQERVRQEMMQVEHISTLLAQAGD